MLNPLPSLHLAAQFLRVDGHFADVALINAGQELRKIIGLSFWAVLPDLTTCHRRMADTTMTSQKITVFTVEFTSGLLD